MGFLAQKKYFATVLLVQKTYFIPLMMNCISSFLFFSCWRIWRLWSLSIKIIVCCFVVWNVEMLIETEAEASERPVFKEQMEHNDSITLKLALGSYGKEQESL